MPKNTMSDGHLLGCVKTKAQRLIHGENSNRDPLPEFSVWLVYLHMVLSPKKRTGGEFPYGLSTEQTHMWRECIALFTMWLR